MNSDGRNVVFHGSDLHAEDGMEIGNGVWIGASAIILAGAIIVQCAVTAAGAMRITPYRI